MSEEMNAWLADADRKAGDTAAFTEESGYNYVLYYIGTNDPAWKLDIHDLLLSQTMVEYLEGISESVAVEDPKENLNYLKIEAARIQESEQEQGEDGTDSSVNESADESAEDVG